MSHYFVPLLVEELINLLRLGKIKIPQGRWSYTEPVGTPYSAKSCFFEELREKIPSFEDTISVVIVEFSSCPHTIPKHYCSPEFSFTDAIATYALTCHDRDILKSRLSQIAKLSENLLIEEEAIQIWKMELFEENSLKGADSLLKIYQGKNYRLSDDKDQVKNLLKALNFRKNDHVSPIINGSYLDNLICYSRSGTIPNNDFGFLTDASCVLRYFRGEVSKKKAEDRYGAFNPSFVERINTLIKEGDAAKFDKLAKLPGALVSSLVFLKLCFLIGEHNESLSPDKLRGLLGEIEDQNSVARGVWWCGGFWGFTQFAEEYYAIASLPETSELQPTHVLDVQTTPEPESSPAELVPIPSVDPAKDPETEPASVAVEPISEPQPVASELPESEPTVETIKPSSTPDLGVCEESHPPISSDSIPPKLDSDLEVSTEPTQEESVDLAQKENPGVSVVAPTSKLNQTPIQEAMNLSPDSADEQPAIDTPLSPSTKP